MFDPLETFPTTPADDSPGASPAEALSTDRADRAGRSGLLDDEPIYAPPRRRPPPATRQRTRRVRQVRRVRRTLRHIDPLSVLKVSLMFYGCFLILWMVFVAILYWIVQAAGGFELVEGVREAFAVAGSWEVSLSFVEKWAFFIGLTAAILMSLVNLFLAFLYNIVADVIGGIDMTFVERD
ncbi:MAG: DUF3566 domain-containing protein [Actinomycetota bacterium]|nr:DUF3566 domain-containing protein [Actinomycetota bacterium]